jgi:hypothetical protein
VTIRSGRSAAAFSASISPHVSPRISMPLMSKPLSALVFSSLSLRKTPFGLMPNDISAAAASPCAMMRVGVFSAV